MEQAREVLRRYNDSVPNDQRIPLGGKGVTIAVLESKIAELGLKTTKKSSPNKKKLSPKNAPTDPILFYGHLAKDGPYYPFSNWARSSLGPAGIAISKIISQRILRNKF